MTVEGRRLYTARRPLGVLRIGAAAILGLACASAVGCILFSDFDGLDTAGGGTGGGSPDGGADADAGGDGPLIACNPVTNALAVDFTQAPPGFVQTYDGDASDTFCLASQSFELRTAGRYRSLCEPAPEWLRQANVNAEVRVGWTSGGVHFSFVVRKDTAIAYDDVQPYHADSVQLYLRDPKTGKQFHDIFYWTPDGQGHQRPGSSQNSALPSKDFGWAMNDGGYTFEFVVPWSHFLDPDTDPRVGVPVGFDFILGTAEPDADVEADKHSQFSAAFCYEADADSGCKPDGSELIDLPESWCNVILKPR